MKKSNLERFPVVAYAFFWIASIISFCVIIFDYSSWIPNGIALQTYIYIDFIHKAWLGLATGWITISCHFGGGIANKFLSNCIFKAGAKLSLAIYLVHLIIQYSIIYCKSSNYTEFAFSELVSVALIISLSCYSCWISLQALSYLLEVSLSTVFALLLFIFIEEPFRNVGKLIIITANMSPKNDTVIDQNGNCIKALEIQIGEKEKGNCNEIVADDLKK